MRSNLKFMTGDGGYTPEFIKLAGDAAEGAYASLPGVPLDKMPGGTEFEKRFVAKYGAIQLYAPYCYDAVNIMIAAMQKAGSAGSGKIPARACQTIIRRGDGKNRVR